MALDPSAHICAEHRRSLLRVLCFDSPQTHPLLSYTYVSQFGASARFCFWLGFRLTWPLLPP